MFSALMGKNELLHVLHSVTMGVLFLTYFSKAEPMR